METILIFLVVIVVPAIFFTGNIYLILGLYDEETWVLIVLAIIADIVLFCWLFSKLATKVGIKLEEKKSKQIADRKELLVKKIENKISCLQKIQRILDKHFKRIEKQLSLLSLISACLLNKNQELKNLLLSKLEEAFVNTKNEIFSKVEDVDKESFPESVSEVADYKKKLKQEISISKKELKSIPSSDEETVSAMMGKYCPEVYRSTKNKKRIKKLLVTVIITIIIVSACVINFIKNTPYRELHSMIENQTLTAEMFDWSNREAENSYYDLIHSERGYKFLASELTKLHRDNDIKKAMWLLCIQPARIDGIDFCASASFIYWVVDYARENGSQETNSIGNKIYYVDGYEITYYSYVPYFIIRNGQGVTVVECRNPYHEGYVPTIQ